MFMIRPHISNNENCFAVCKIEIVLGKEISSKHVEMSSSFFPH